MEEKLWKACSDGKVEEVRTLLQNSQININWQDSEYSRTPFYRACFFGHIKIVELLLNDKRVDINKAKNDGATPFYIACYHGHLEIVKLLLSGNRIEINKANKNDATPFYIACEKGQIEIVKLLLNDKRVDINKAMNGDFTPFYHACQNGHIEVVKLLLNDKRVDINYAQSKGATPFYIACFYGRIEIVKLLLNDNRVDINKADKDGSTPFLMACCNGHIDIVKYLLVCGREIDINKKFNNTTTPLDISKERSSGLKLSDDTEEEFQKAKRNCPKIVELIESFQRNPSETRAKLRKELGKDEKMEEQLWKACVNGKVEEVKKLLQNSQININWQDFEYSTTPLFNACGYGHIEIVKLLLNDIRVEINQTNTGATPFYIACEKGHIEIVKLLLNDKRIDVNKSTNGCGATPFYIACQKGHIEIVKLLLNDQRVDINKPENDDGATPFFIACQKGHIEIVKLLLNDERVDINQTETSIGATPFSIACCYGHIEIVKYLLESRREIDINKKWDNIKTPLEISKERSTSTQKFEWESEEEFQKAKRNCPKIVEFIESFQKRIEAEKRKEEEKKLEEQKKKEAERKLEEERKKIEEEKKKLEEKRKEEERKLEEEKRKKEESKRSTYEIEYNAEIFKLRTTAKTLEELENDIKLKIKLQESANIRLYFKENGKYIVLDDMEDLEDGTIIKVSTVSAQPQQNVINHEISNLKISSSSSNPSVFLTHTWVKDELNRDNHARVGTINKLLKAQGFQTWFDEDKMEGHIDQKMAEGINGSKVILVFITKTYMEKLNSKGHDNCKGEFTYATTRNKKMIPIVMEPCMKNPGQWDGPLGIRLAGDLYVDMSGTDSEFNITTLVDRLKRT